MAETNPEALSADSSTLIKQSVWCGAVCALAVVLTSLNMYPPVNVQYKVNARVVVSQPRLEQLKAVLERDRQVIASGQLRYVQLYKVNLLDEVKNDGLLLVELESLWTGRASPTHIEAWLSTVTKTEPRKLVDSAEARAERYARWQAETAKHYLRRHQYICSAQQHSTVPTQLASSTTNADSSTDTGSASNNVGNGKIPAKFATMSGGSADANDKVAAMTTSGQLEFDDPVVIEKKLTDSVKQAEAVAVKSQLQFSKALERHAGAIELVGTPRVRSKTSHIPTWMSASVVILAMATGAIASLLQYRVQSGGAYDPEFVAKQLAMEGLPVVAELKLAPIGPEPISRTSGFTSALKNTLGRHLGNVGEGLLMIWCVAITCRILFDPLWRNVAIESPLAAFGRLVTGMP